ncbi:MAG: 4-hydroxy-3-methylbut-2-enyl diphosphate reductase [Spirochaetaceae bacterium]|jgi:4-hydroxy-3-methylbut-2-enyl diphosphate reductase|nr:4-hydroxy-3-methylbut-2-enyl diphosphate reductase [Spirochaetaceae bacterium]
MKVIRADVMGFCMGVRRAVDMAVKISEGACGPVYTLGPLIHNKAALDGLALRGVHVLDEDTREAGLAGRPLIIRAHGIPPREEAELKQEGAVVWDATCPRVKKNQLTAKALYEAGYTIFLAGEKGHGEIAGIAGYAPYSILVGSVEDAEAAAQSLYSMSIKNNAHFLTALLGQTTIGVEEYNRIAAVVMRYFPSLRVEDTICGATRDRQAALAALCGKVDAVLVAGDSRSANTRRLAAIAAERRPAWLVEDAAALPPEIFDFTTVGLSAGASTPAALIDEIEQKLI